MPDLRRIIHEEKAAILATCRPDAVERWRERAEEACSAHEWRRAERYRFDRLRRRFLCGRAMLRHVLAGIDGRRPDGVELDSTPRGQVTTSVPGIAISISYSENFVGVLVGCGAPGLDLEDVRRECDIVGIASHAFRDEERRMLESLSPTEARDFFFQVWVEKEAVSKAMGLGMAIGFDRLDARAVALSMGAVLRTHRLDPFYLMATVVSESCEGIVRFGWDGNAPIDLGTLVGRS